MGGGSLGLRLGLACTLVAILVISVIPLARKLPAQMEAREEAVIRGKVEQAGYAEVSDLSRDSNGIWHGRAKKDDEAVDIVIDKGGRVTAPRR